MKRVNTSIKPMSKDHGSVNVSIRDMVLLGATWAGWAFNYATLSSRANADEKAIIDLQQRYEKEVVPRTEHVEMNRRLDGCPWVPIFVARQERHWDAQERNVSPDTNLKTAMQKRRKKEAHRNVPLVNCFLPACFFIYADLRNLRQKFICGKTAG